jgi:hypothetical protein
MSNFEVSITRDFDQPKLSIFVHKDDTEFFKGRLINIYGTSPNYCFDYVLQTSSKIAAFFAVIFYCLNFFNRYRLVAIPKKNQDYTYYLLRNFSPTDKLFNGVTCEEFCFGLGRTYSLPEKGKAISSKAN